MGNKNNISVPLGLIIIAIFGIIVIVSMITSIEKLTNYNTITNNIEAFK